MPNEAAARPLVGGHPALDLVNTVAWRLDDARRRDHIADAAALLTWCEHAGVMDADTAVRVRNDVAAHPVVARRGVRETQLLRRLLTEHLGLLAGHHEPDSVLAAPAQLHEFFADAVAHAVLSGVPGRWRLAVRTPTDLTRSLALAALDLLQSPRLEALRQCAGPGCGWMFLDRTRSHTRRYCLTDDCGNRDRARRHYARQQQLKDKG